jgi:hypothetical protein
VRQLGTRVLHYILHRISSFRSKGGRGVELLLLVRQASFLRGIWRSGLPHGSVAATCPRLQTENRMFYGVFVPSRTEQYTIPVLTKFECRNAISHNNCSDRLTHNVLGQSHQCRGYLSFWNGLYTGGKHGCGWVQPVGFRSPTKPNEGIYSGIFGIFFGTLCVGAARKTSNPPGVLGEHPNHTQ